MNDRHKMWNALKDYDLFLKLTLENNIKGKMPCNYCVAEYMNGMHKQQSKVDVKDFGLNVVSRSSAFTSIMMVECHSRKHSFAIKLPRRQ